MVQLGQEVCKDATDVGWVERCSVGKRGRPTAKDDVVYLCPFARSGVRLDGFREPRCHKLRSDCAHFGINIRHGLAQEPGGVPRPCAWVPGQYVNDAGVLLLWVARQPSIKVFLHVVGVGIHTARGDDCAFGR